MQALHDKLHEVLRVPHIDGWEENVLAAIGAVMIAGMIVSGVATLFLG